MNTTNETIKPLPLAPDRALLLSGSDADKQKFSEQWDALNDAIVNLTEDLNRIADRIEQQQKETK
jgi:hypothetical protein